MATAYEQQLETDQRSNNIRVLANLTPEKLAALSPQEREVMGEILSGLGINPLNTKLNQAQIVEQVKADATNRLATNYNQKPSGKPIAAPSTAGSAQSLEQQIAKDPLAQLSQNILGQFYTDMGPIEAAVGGNLTQPAQQSAIGTALTALGQSPAGSGAQWLEGQTATVDKATDPLSAAMAAYGSAYTAGMAGIGNALANVGQAQALEVATATEQPWLQAAISHIGYPTGYENVGPGETATMPPALQFALSQMGWTGVAPPKGGWGSNAPKTAPGTPSIASSLVGSAPSASTQGSPTSGSTSPGYLGS